jgi:hypothetical protein
MSWNIEFWSNREIKMPRIVVFWLYREIKMPRNPKFAQKDREIKMPRKFHAAKISCIKVSVLTRKKRDN